MLSNRTTFAEPAAPDQVSLLGRVTPLLLPALFLALGLVLPRFMFWSGNPPVAQGLGPGAWPRLALHGVALFAGIWLAQEIRVLVRAGGQSLLNAQEDEETYRTGKALLGICLVILYGAFLSITGFALTTIVFIAVWCFYGGVRNPVAVAAVSLVGTGVLLWTFMGLALMPLSRGHGVFDQFSIWLLQTLAIY